MPVLTEEAGQVGADGVDELVELTAVGRVEPLHVGADAVALERAQPLGEPRLDQLLLAPVQVDAAVAVDDLGKLALELAVRDVELS